MKDIEFDIIGTCVFGGIVEIKIKIDRRLAVREVGFVIGKDGGEEAEYRLFYAGLEKGYDIYSYGFAAETAGLYFYYFRADGRTAGLDGKHFKIALDSHKKFQLTVYEQIFAEPRFLHGGIMYQIFPDRFCREQGMLELNQSEPVPCSLSLVPWHEVPDHRPDQGGKILNNYFYGGNLQGIIAKLPYLKSLGVTAIYLNPIFRAFSNHRYDTGDYFTVDPLLGTNEDFEELCRLAKERGISIILDGVFSHTGSDSIYFNKNGSYPLPGAYQSKESPYYGWYNFEEFPDKYECWWDFVTLPAVNKDCQSYRDFICGTDGVVRTWIRRGASGFRLDVADELNDSFIEELVAAVKAERTGAVVYGEVWEDASNKVSYGVRRKYLQGRGLDSVMNYPFRTAILKFLTGGSSHDMAYIVSSIASHYPPAALNTVMNLVSSHDTGRALTLLGHAECPPDKDARAVFRLSGKQKERGKELLRLAVVMQYTLPGVPCVYYGDEAGMESFGDPFCRAGYVWGREDPELVEFFVKLGKIRKGLADILSDGSFRALETGRGRVFAYERVSISGKILVIINAGEQKYRANLCGEYVDVFTGESVSGKVVAQPVSYFIGKGEQVIGNR